MTIDPFHTPNPNETGICPQCGAATVIAIPAEPDVGIMEPRMACDGCKEYVDEMSASVATQ